MPNQEPVNRGQGSVSTDGAAVARMRLAKGLTQDQLAHATGLSNTTIGNLEGGAPARVTNLRAVAKALGVELADLVCDAAKPDFRPPAAPVVPPSAVPPHRPQQLPTGLKDFVGRAGEIERMTARLAGDAGGTVELSAVNGMGGVGKTSLAVHVAHRIKDEFPGGHLFLDLGGMLTEPMSVPRALARLLHSLRPEARLPDSADQLAADYRSAAAAVGRVLVVLDNADGADQVRPLIPGPPAAVVVTSRRRLSLSEYGAESIALDVLAENEAVALLRGVLGAEGRDADLRELAALCGCLPLALRVAGDFLRERVDWSVRQYLAVLRDEGVRRLRAGGRDVEAVLTLSAAQLARDSAERATRWALLSGLEGGFDRDMAAAVWDATGRDAGVADDLSDLTARGMLLFDPATGLYQLHDLMRPIAEGLFGGAPPP